MADHDNGPPVCAGQAAYCPSCNQQKPISEFGKDKNLPTGHTLWCKPCRNARQKRHKAERAAKPHPHPSDDSKRCPRCGVLKHLSEFGRDLSTRLGIKSLCTQCTLEKQRSDYDPAAARERSKDYRARNPDKVKAANDRRKDDVEKARRQNKKSKSNRKAQIKAYNKAYYAANSERELARALAWQAANPVQTRANVRHQNKARKARERGAVGRLTRKEWEAILHYFGHCCAYCLQHQSDIGCLEQDHMLPVSRHGSLNPENVVPACRSCNASKLHRTPLEFMAWKDGFMGF